MQFISSMHFLIYLWIHTLSNNANFCSVMYSGREGHCRGGQGRCGSPKNRRWPPKGRPSAAAQPRPPICLKIDSLAYEWLTRLLSRTHAQAASLSVCLCMHRPHYMLASRRQTLTRGERVW